ncbi:hypothetical protein SAMN05444007_105124 [Cribrihabitans marinus]|uniref:Uncharacterized protein n=1 Tax=Cribrihabitans marinus TaxID=1227549 RepID=A0A1H6ZTN9_9RHOB|nr:hypothetical protein [Cribrihabitans marinus]GGH30758.1 hypothetical protein GCM10010973_21120 [Cribrihabitans marinus]SEJ52185.1 hypothetical protein SAMN05444007_105124 [Cribrihabitans marinus]
MAAKRARPHPFNIVIVGQNNRLQYEALLFAASLRHAAPDFAGRLLVAVPQPGPLWPSDPSIRNTELLAALDRLGAEIVPFDNTVFGADYPQGNKIEALLALPEGEPFVFFDTDTLITGDIARVPFDFDRPTASLKREGTWPEPTLYGPGYAQIWKSLYDRFGLEFESSLDLDQPDEYWARYLYFNAGWFFYRCPRAFGHRFLDYAREIRDDPPAELICQNLDPWLDQVALPLVIHSFGGGRDPLPAQALDGDVSCHYRLFPLLYAREDDRVVEMLETVAAPNWIKKVLKQYEPIRKLVLQRKGERVRALFDQANLPRREQAIRNRIKSAGLWLR